MRSLAELAVLAAHLVFVPTLFEAVLNGFGIRAEGLTQVIGTSILYGGFVAVAILLVKLRGQVLADIGLKRPPNLVRSAFLGLAVDFAVNGRRDIQINSHRPARRVYRRSVQ